MNSLINLALVGASGVVGKKIISLLENKNIEINNFYPLGSTSVGDEIAFNNNEYKIEDLTNFDYSKVNLAIFSAGSKVAEEHAKDFVNAGVYVIDLSSKFRYEKDIPLIIPEINGNEINLLDAPSIISNPNCSTSQLLMAIAPIHKEYEIDILNIATYQAVSGTGKQAVQELKNQIKDESVNQEVYPKKIAFNVIPHIDIFMDDGFTKEEWKMRVETKKILDPNIDLVAHCVRVPVFIGHSEAVFIECKKDIDEKNVRSLLRDANGVTVVDHRADEGYVTPEEVAGEDDVYISRIRKDPSVKNGIAFWCVGDNLRKGAALNTVQIAELLASKKIKGVAL